MILSFLVFLYLSILTHELGHVITESKPCKIDNNGIYSWAKITTTFYQNCGYQDGELHANRWFGFRMADVFFRVYMY